MPCLLACLLKCLYTLSSRFLNIKYLPKGCCITIFFRTSMPWQKFKKSIRGLKLPKVPLEPFKLLKLLKPFFVTYAIVDIETTGGYAAANGIIEICIKIFDGERIIEEFETLVNPNQNIPRYIQAFTGINNEMVQNAPSFEEIAERVYTYLQGNVFVAHNVNFDYSF